MAKATPSERIQAWLTRLVAGEVPASVVAFNVGLYETPQGYAAYLIGSDEYDEANGDWR